MDNNKSDLTVGSIWKKMIVFSVPLMLSNILQVLFNLSDIAVVGKFSGSAALGEVGSTATLVAMYIAFLIGVANSINVLVAQYYGAKNDTEVSRTIHTGFTVSLLTGLIILAFGEISVRPLLNLLGTKDELVDGAELYLRIYLCGLPALALYNYGNAIYSAIGNTKKPLYFLSLSGVVNVILNLFFVISCGMDVEGVAIASVIAQYLSAILILISLMRRQDICQLRLTRISFIRDKARQIVSIGIPSGLQMSIFQIANLFIQGGVNTFDATLVSGNSAAANADCLVYDVMAAFYTAGSSFIGQNYGAGKKERIKKSFLISIVYSFGIGIIMGVTLVIFGRDFLHMFTNDTEVIDAGMYRLRIMGLSYGFSAFMDAAIAASRGLGKTLVPTIVVIIGSCVFRVVWVYTVFMYFGTIESLYLLYIFSWSLTALAEIIYFRKIYRAI